MWQPGATRVWQRLRTSGWWSRCGTASRGLAHALCTATPARFPTMTQSRARPTSDESPFNEPVFEKVLRQ